MPATKSGPVCTAVRRRAQDLRAGVSHFSAARQSRRAAGRTTNGRFQRGAESSAAEWSRWYRAAVSKDCHNACIDEGVLAGAH